MNLLLHVITNTLQLAQSFLNTYDELHYVFCFLTHKNVFWDVG